MVMPTRSPTVGEYLDYWLAEVAMPRLRPTTIAKYRTAIELYLRPALGTQKIDQLTVATRPALPQHPPGGGRLGAEAALDPRGPQLRARPGAA